MSLIAVRQLFATDSGRHDLVTNFAAGTYTNVGADRFINAGQRMLDRKASFLKSSAWYKKDCLVGVYKLQFRHCIAMKEVWAKCSGEARFPLNKADLDWLREEYGDTYSTLTTGVPEYYAPLVQGLASDQSALTSVNYTAQFTEDFEEITFADYGTNAGHTMYQGIIWMPPLDKTYTISVLGKFYSKPLSADADVSFWTEQHSDLLVLAAMWALEGVYRNSEGQNDYMKVINDALFDLDKDVVEEEIQGINQMEG